MHTIASFDIGKKNFAWYIERIYNNKSITVLDMKVFSFQNRNELFDIFCSNKEIWNKCDYFIIENQQRFRVKNNIIMIQIAEATFSWFLINYPNKIITYFNPSHKIKCFVRKKMTYKERKKWTVSKCREYFLEKNMISFVDFYDGKVYTSPCPEFIKKINTKKLDDISDACMQCQAFKLMNKI